MQIDYLAEARLIAADESKSTEERNCSFREK